MNGPAVAAPPRELLRLDHNERLFSAPELAALLAGVPATTLTRYPDAAGLEGRLADMWGLEPDRVLVTAGADDAIDRICRLQLAGGRDMITVAPTFEMMQFFATLAGGRVREIPTLADPAPGASILERLGDRTGLVTVISPHNPTGIVVPASRLLEIAERLPPDAMLLADLAYVEFADSDPARALLERDNILVCGRSRRRGGWRGSGSGAYWAHVGRLTPFGRAGLRSLCRARRSGSPSGRWRWVTGSPRRMWPLSATSATGCAPRCAHGAPSLSPPRRTSCSPPATDRPGCSAVSTAMGSP